jgi:hypothetical protein
VSLVCNNLGLWLYQRHERKLLARLGLYSYTMISIILVTTTVPGQGSPKLERLAKNTITLRVYLPPDLHPVVLHSTNQRRKISFLSRHALNGAQYAYLSDPLLISPYCK